MSERHRIAAVVLGVTALLAIGMVGVGAADGHGAETNETEERLSPGERLAGTMSVQETELEGEVEKRSFEKRLEREDEQRQSELASEQIEQLEADLESIEQRAETLRDDLEAGEITRSQFHSQIAQLRVEAESKADIAERASEFVTADLADEQQEIVATIVDLRVRASEIVDDDDEEAVENFVSPDVRDEEPDRVSESDLEPIADGLAADLERADRRAQESGDLQRDTAELPDEIRDSEYTITIRGTADGGVVQVTLSDRDLSATSSFTAAATVVDSELPGGAAGYAAAPEQLTVEPSESDESDTVDDQAARSVGERVATALERADRAAHERGDAVTGTLELPSEIRDQPYTVTISPEGDAGVVAVETRDGEIRYTTSFDVRATVERSDVRGGEIGLTADPERVVLGEREADDSADGPEAETIADRLATTLSEADRIAHETDGAVSDRLNLPEEIDGDSYAITVRATDDGGVILVTGEYQRATTEFSTRSTVENSRVAGGPTVYTVDTESVVLGEESEDDDDRVAGDIAAELAGELEAADRRAQESGDRVTDRIELPDTIDDNRYTITIRPTDEGGLVEIETAAGTMSTAEFTAHASVIDTRVSGGTVVYGATPDELFVGDSDGDDDQTTVVSELAAEFETIAERAADGDGTVHAAFDLPAEFDGERYELRIEAVSGGGELAVTTADGTVIEEQFRAPMTVESAQFAAGDAVTITADAERFVFEEREDDDDDARTPTDPSPDRAAAELADLFETADERAQDRGERVTDGLTLPPALDDVRYEVVIEPTDNGGVVTISEFDGPRLAEAAFETHATVESATFVGGEELVLAVDTERMVFSSDTSEDDTRDRDGDDTDDTRDRDGDDTDDRNPEAIEFGEELAEFFAASDERAQESGDSMSQAIGLPDALDGERYELRIEGQDDGGVITIVSEGGEQLHQTAFDATATVEGDSFAAGETLEFVVDPSEFRFGEREDEDDEEEEDEDDGADREELAMEIAEGVAGNLERADRQAHDEDQSITREVDLPETLDGERYEIAVRATDDGGSVLIASEESDLRYTAEFGSISEVQSVELSGGPISITADTERLVIEG